MRMDRATGHPTRVQSPYEAVAQSLQSSDTVNAYKVDPCAVVGWNPYLHALHISHLEVYDKDASREVTQDFFH